MDEARLQKFVDQVVLDMGAAFGAATVVLGDRLGLWKAMAGAGPIVAGELARRTGTNERLIAEWLAAQAAAGYVSYDDGAYTLTDEQATVFADDSSPVFMTGIAEMISSVYRDEDKLVVGLSGAQPYTLEEVGRAFGVTRERIRQIENNTLKKLEGLPEAQALKDCV